MRINPLPPAPKLRVDPELLSIVSEIERKLAQIDGCMILDSGGIFEELLSVREASFSLNMDYPQKSPIDFNSYYLEVPESKDAINRYNKSLLLGQKLLKDVSCVSHIVKSIHKELIEKENSTAGLFRNKLVWVNDSSKQQSDSKYIAPVPEEINSMMRDLESYLAINVSYPAIINAALVHAQFEIIHPFESHNGLVGRILIHLHLLWKKKLSTPVLQISRTLNKHKLEYFDRLGDLEKNGNWNGWLKFFLHIINESASDTILSIKNIHLQREVDFKILLEKEFVSTASIGLLNFITRNPVFTISQITNGLGYTKQTVGLLIKKFEEEKIIEELSGKKRYRTYAYKTILDNLTFTQ